VRLIKKDCACSIFELQAQPIAEFLTARRRIFFLHGNSVINKSKEVFMESSIETSLSTALPSSDLSICFVDNENAEAMVSSREVAAKFGKRHDNVMQAIEKELSYAGREQFNALNFKDVEYIDAKGETRKEIHMAKDGFCLVAMSFTGEEAASWKIKFLQAFNEILGYAMELRAEIARKELLIQSLQKQLGKTPKKHKFYIQVAVPADTLPGFPQRFAQESRPAEDVPEPQKTMGHIIHLNKIISGATEKRDALMASIGLI
jgi:Rha family phage regulatory protein